MGIEQHETAGGAGPLEDGTVCELFDEIRLYEESCKIAPEESAINEIIAARASDRAGGGTEAPSSIDKLVSIGRSCVDWNRYVREIDECLQRKMGRFESVRLREWTPASLRELGMRNLPMNHTQKHLRDELHPEVDEDQSGGNHYHGLSMETVRRLPELLEHPWAIWDARPGKEGVSVALSAVDSKGAPLIAVVNPNGSCFDDTKANNFIKTVYGRMNIASKIEEAFGTGRALSFDIGEFERFSETGLMNQWVKEKLGPCVEAHCVQAYPSKSIIAGGAYGVQQPSQQSTEPTQAGAGKALRGRFVIHPSLKLHPVDEDSDPYLAAQRAWDAAHRRNVDPASAPYEQQIEAWQEQRLTPGRLRLSEDSLRVFDSIGLPTLPVTLPRSVLRNHLEPVGRYQSKPAVPMEALRSLPSLISEPIAAWDARPGQCHVYVALAATDLDGSILIAKVAPAALDRNTGERSHIILSARGCPYADSLIEEAAATGRLLYADRDAAAKLPLSSRPIVPSAKDGPLLHATLKGRFTPYESDPYLAAQRAWDEAHPRRSGRRPDADIEKAKRGAERTRRVGPPQSGRWNTKGGGRKTPSR
ncbi:MAG: hypothetical protein JNG53_05560 [Senegalimassilia sp.]|nr:hypothetical protein [Senegalimassilia sp.]